MWVRNWWAAEGVGRRRSCTGFCYMCNVEDSKVDANKNVPQGLIYCLISSELDGFGVVDHLLDIERTD
jgi:hypothetical protein